MGRFSVAVVTVSYTVLLPGCGGSAICQRIDGVAASLSAKIQGCSNVGPSTSAAVFSKTACLSGLDKCSDADQRALWAQLDCLANLVACVPGQESQYLARLSVCQFTAAAVSTPCSTALQASR